MHGTHDQVNDALDRFRGWAGHTGASIGTVEVVLSPTVDRPIRVARAAVFTVFALNGFLLAMWVVHIPVVTDRTGVAKSTLGMFILLMAGAGIVGMRLAGPLADRLGSRTLVGTAACIASVAVLGPGLATGPVTLAIALACFGFGNGALDVSMNTQAVHVERAYRRPIMAAFHALFSGGGLLGSLVGAATLRAGCDVRLTLAAAALGCVALTLALVPHLLRDTTFDAETAVETTIHGVSAGHDTPLPEQGGELGKHDTTPLERETALLDVHPEHDMTPARPDGAPTGYDAAPALGEPDPNTSEHTALATVTDTRDRSRKVLALAAIAFALLLAEGVAADWSTLQMREHLGADEATAALAFGAFSTTMTVGRFGTDRVSHAFGRVAVVRYGALIAAVGLAVIIVSPWVALTLLGWAMAGLGLAGGVPQIFTAAGNLGSDTAATDMSRVFSVGYLGLLAGPTVIGWLTAVVSLTTAMVVPLVAMLLCCRYASVVAAPRKPTWVAPGTA
ncbi:MFS transporter [Nocardia sp. NPDC051787]|uniref:MFS transporter n=1 Tax=Nocardia sp. NPDC051787 TaxID=3155415 RepID=UPI0034401664